MAEAEHDLYCLCEACDRERREAREESLEMSQARQEASAVLGDWRPEDDDDDDDSDPHDNDYCPDCHRVHCTDGDDEWCEEEKAERAALELD